MSTRSKSLTPDHPIVILFVIIAVVSSMYFASGVLKPLALSILLSFALTPAAAWLERRGLPRAPSVVLTVLVSLGLLVGVGFVVLKQLDSLAGEVPKYEQNIASKIERFGKAGTGRIEEVTKVYKETINQAKDAPNNEEGVQRVRVVGETGYREVISSAVGPFLETVGVGSFVLILTLFMMMTRENLGDRVIQLFGRRQISLTTKTMEEVSERIMRYLTAFTLVNTCYGIIIGTGLHFMGIKYAVLWGFLAAITRFIPYAGPLLAFSLPSLYAFAAFEDWYHVLGVIALFGVLETILNSFLEPVLYGRTTGVTALGLLVAALFWTWLWGILGLILSTPITVSLAVLGKYVPSLRFFSTLLGEEAELPQDLRLYQRFLALDEEGANLLIEEALKTRTRTDVFEHLLLPTLAYCERDYARGEVEDREQTFLWRIIGEVLDSLEDTPEIALRTAAEAASGQNASELPEEPVDVAGVPAEDMADVLVLRMLAMLVDPKQCRLSVLPPNETPLAVSERLEQENPRLVLVSHVPPVGLSATRYLVQRLHTRDADRPIFVGRWGEGGNADKSADRLVASGASQVVFSLTDARDRIQNAIKPKTAEKPDLSPALAN